MNLLPVINKGCFPLHPIATAKAIQTLFNAVIMTLKTLNFPSVVLFSDLCLAV